MLWNHVCFDYYNASPHTLQYSCLDKLRVLTFMSAEHDVRVKTLLPKGANRTNLQPSSQDRCQSHWCCRAVCKSVLYRLLWQKYSAHPFLIYKHVRVCTIFIDIYDEFPLCLIVAHTLPNRHDLFAIEMFCQWSSVSTISRTTLWRRYDKERLSILCRKVSGKTKHFARYVPSVWLEGHSFLMSYWLPMSV